MSDPMRLSAAAAALSAYARTRWLARRLRSRADLERYQAARIRSMLRTVVPGVPFYRGSDAQRLQDLPVVDKATLMADFASFNRAGIGADAVRAALAAGTDRIGEWSVGQSTGTSGNRGAYVVSKAERFVWLGTLLAKALPDALWRRHRVALALPGLSTLYRSAASGSRIALGFFDLARGVDAWADELAAFAPDTIVAPPKVLRYLAEAGKLHASTLFSGAEVLDPLDRRLIEAATGRQVREIYMATEGLFGVACSHGTLHLCEDVVHFEWEPVGAGSGLRTPIVTDFTRSAQVMARYRMNDLLELSEQACGCGSPLQAVRQVVGRQDDVFLLAAAGGSTRTITPDVLRNAVVDADPRIQDFRILQTGPARVEVELDAALDAAAHQRVLQGMRRLCEHLGVGPLDIRTHAGFSPAPHQKLRRVRREWQPGPDGS